MKKAVAITQTAIDVAEKVIEDVKHAADAVCDTVVSAAAAVQNAWDNLDPGLKQWIIAGVSMAVSFIPLVGPILACVVDGTFVDMINALKNGDWATLGMCALNFIPGGKVLKGVKAVGGLEKAGKVIAPYKVLSKTAAKEGKQAHKLIEKRLIPALHP